jgi:hypothetical protein
MKLFRALFLTLTTCIAGTAVAQTNPFSTVQIARDPYVEVVSVFAQMKLGAAPPRTLDVIFFDSKGAVSALLKSLPVTALPSSRWIYATPVSVVDTELYINIANAASFTVVVNRTTPVAATQRYMEYLVPFDVWATSGPCPNCTLLYLCGCLDPVYGVTPNVDYCGAIQPIQGCGTL